MRAPTHHCHWPGCQKEVPPRLWGCLEHWNKLPAAIKRGILSTYVPGQELTMNPSAAYIAAAKAAREWALEYKSAMARALERTSNEL